MTFLPIVERELRVRARLRSTFGFRFFAAMAAILVVAVLLLADAIFNFIPTLGARIFSVLAFLAFVYCLMEGSRNTADSLSREKRDGTLGLLFLTDLRGYDVVIGKLVAGSLNTFYGLLAILPMLAIPLLMGGVTGAEFWRVALILLNTLFFSLAAGMFASALVKSARQAAGLCTAIVVGTAGLLPLAAAIYAGVYDTHQPPEWLLIPSPGYALYTAFDTNHSGNEAKFLISCAIGHGLAWFFL